MLTGTPSIDEIPTELNSTKAFISGYLNIWFPDPVEFNRTKLPLSKLEVVLPSNPPSDNLNELSSTLRT